MTAKILAILGTLGILTTIWTSDLRSMWTGIILLLISIGVAANADNKRNERDSLIGHNEPRAGKWPRTPQNNPRSAHGPVTGQLASHILTSRLERNTARSRGFAI